MQPPLSLATVWDPMDDRSLEVPSKATIEELKSKIRDLEMFGSWLAHDIRAPLRAVAFTSQILREEHGSELSPEAMHLLNQQVIAAKRASEIIEDVSRLTQIEHAALQHVRFDLTRLAREVEADFALGSVVQLDVDAGLVADADPRLIKLLLRNLFENCIKYAGPTGPSISFRGSDDAVPVYCVRDNGIGFKQEDASRIFRPFERLVTQQHVSGNGLGLSIVQRIAERHGGKAWAESEPFRGASFFFTLSS
jgi:signal transduction histidine kinase